MEQPGDAVQGADDTVFFGHPRGLGFLAFTQVWERFSFYGMQALLTLYMIHQLLLPGHVENVIGFEGFRRAIEAVVGPLTPLALASQIFGLYAGLISMTPLVGAWLGDRVLGQRMTAVLGLVMMTAGHWAMAFEAAFLLAMLLLVIGAGLVKGNMYAQVGQLYAAGDGRRTRAFSIYLIALNVGAILAPLVCGTLGEVYGWHWGFGAAGFGMLIGLATYVAGWRHLPPERERAAGPSEKLRPDERRAVTAVMLMLVPALLLMTAGFQAFNILIVWAEAHVDRSIFGMTMPVTWFFSFDGLMTIVGIAITIPLWRKLAAQGREPDTMLKFVVASMLVTAAYAVLATGTTLLAVVPVAVVFLFFVFLDLSWAWIDPPTNGFVSRFAPASMVTFLMSVGLMVTYGLPNLIVGWLGRFYEPMGPAGFWMLHAGIASSAGVVALALRPVIAGLLGNHVEGRLAPAASTAF